MLTGVEVLNDVLIKVRDSKRQATLSRQERMDNLSGTFKITDKKVIQDKTFLLVDDVMTTGATAETISKLLKEKGAKCVYVLTVCSTFYEN